MSYEALAENNRHTHANLNVCIEQRQRLEEQLETAQRAATYLRQCNEKNAARAGRAEEQLEAVQRASDNAHHALHGATVRAERLEEQLEAYRAALTIIADRVYPATYLGTDLRGIKLYGGSDDASRFAREVLDSNPAKEQKP